MNINWVKNYKLRLESRHVTIPKLPSFASHDVNRQKDQKLVFIFTIAQVQDRDARNSSHCWINSYCRVVPRHRHGGRRYTPSDKIGAGTVL